jgi:glucose-1-phosphate cytidylyltransferase
MSYLEGEEDFCFTYGDGLADIDITELIAFHRAQATVATVTAVQPPGRFGALDIEDDRVQSFREKPRGDGAWTNGGFFVLTPAVAAYLGSGLDVVWEQDPVRDLARDGQLASYHHHGFWQPMDTVRDRSTLERLWESGRPPWRSWE